MIFIIILGLLSLILFILRMKLTKYDVFVANIIFAISVFLFVLCIINIFSYLSSGYKSEIINHRFNTNYTQEQMFWASDVIEEIRRLDRKKVENDFDEVYNNIR